MFRWAACQLDLSSDCRNVGKLREALNILPTRLDETYHRILSNIKPLYKPEVLHILQWLTCSLRPLSLAEVAEIVAFNVDNDNRFNGENRFAEPKEVLTICSSLVISLNTDGDDDEKACKVNSIAETSALEPGVTMVRLADFSVKEYLVSSRIRTGSAAFLCTDEKTSDSVTGETSLSCRQLYDEASFVNSEEFSKEFMLAPSAAEYWNNHHLNNNGKVRSRAIQLFLPEKQLRNSIALFDMDSDDSGLERVPKSAGS